YVDDSAPNLSIGGQQKLNTLFQVSNFSNTSDQHLWFQLSATRLGKGPIPTVKVSRFGQRKCLLFSVIKHFDNLLATQLLDLLRHFAVIAEYELWLLQSIRIDPVISVNQH